MTEVLLRNPEVRSYLIPTFKWKFHSDSATWAFFHPLEMIRFKKFNHHSISIIQEEKEEEKREVNLVDKSPNDICQIVLVRRNGHIDMKPRSMLAKPVVIKLPARS